MNPLTRDILGLLWPIVVIVLGSFLHLRRTSDRNQQNMANLQHEFETALVEFKSFVSNNQSVIINHTISLSIMTKTLDSLLNKIDSLDKRTNDVEKTVAVLESRTKD